MACVENDPNARYKFFESADKWIALIGAILPYVGTCFIGIVAVWQNKELNKVNERLLKIEERKVIPKLLCKANNMKHVGEGVCLYFQVEHRSGEEAYNLQITDVVISQGEQVLTQTYMLQRSDDVLYPDGHLIYWVECSDVVDEMSEIKMRFTLCYEDVMGISHKRPQRIYWKNHSRNEYRDHNSVEKGSENANECEPAAVS